MRSKTQGPGTVKTKPPGRKAKLTLKTRAKAMGVPGNASAPARILVVADKFKGTLSAADASGAIVKGWKSMRPQDQFDRLPMSDGGDGFGEVLGGLYKARTHFVGTVNAAHRSIRAPWWWAGGQKLAVIETARVIGPAGLAAKKFHPFQLDTYGLGRMLAAAVERGARHCVVGLGGSATNDGGFGLGRALGWRFLDHSGQELQQWWELSRLVRVIRPANAYGMEVTVAVDVANPLLGRRGCSRVYGPQKGILPEELAFAEKCLRQLAEVMEERSGKAHARVPGAGAAGGLGFGLMAFMGAKPRPGFEVFAQAVDLPEHIRQSDVVITGEGALDRQTYMGKGVGQVLRLCRSSNVPCIALAGVVDPTVAGNGFFRTHALTDIATLEQAKRRARYHLERLSAMVASGWTGP